MTSAISNRSPIWNIVLKICFIDKHGKPIDKDIGLRMFQVAERRLLIACVVQSAMTRYPAQQAGVAVAIDSAMIVLFALYLLASFSRKIVPAPGR